jgi:hypothetical protein
MPYADQNRPTCDEPLILWLSIAWLSKDHTTYS